MTDISTQFMDCVYRGGINKLEIMLEMAFEIMTIDDQGLTLTALFLCYTRGTARSS